MVQVGQGLCESERPLLHGERSSEEAPGDLVGAPGRRYLRASALLRAPLYILWKLPLYAAFLRGPESRWRRTPRRP